MLLNFGHTVGHAVEKASGFSIRHGDAVSIGIVAECEISRQKGLLSAHDCARIRCLLESFGLMTRTGGPGPESIINNLARDKKSRAGIPSFVLLEGLGSAIANCAASPKSVETAIRTVA